MTDIKDTSGRGFLLAYIELQKEQIQAAQQQLERFANDFSYLLAADNEQSAFSSASKVVWQNDFFESGRCIDHVPGLCLKIASRTGQSAEYCENLANAARAFISIHHGTRVEHTELVSVLALEIGLFRREFFNGKGTPYNIAGKDIPLAARVFALAEYATSITAACNDEGKSNHEGCKSLNELLRLSYGKIFDPELVDALIAILEVGEAS